MKKSYKMLLVCASSIAAAAALNSCDVKKTQDGEMPDVKVEGEVKVPKYDVDAPDVDVKMEKKEIEVPTIEVTPADEDTNDQ